MVAQTGAIGVFLDRDGTIVEEIGYLSHPKQAILLPHTAEAIRMLNQRGIPVFVATNQSGVARGFFSEDTVREIHRYLGKTLREAGAVIKHFYYCPHHPECGDGPYGQVCTCRKPDIGMLQEAARDFNVDLSRSYLIGDSSRDLQAAHNAGMKAVLVLSGYGKETQKLLTNSNTTIRPHFVAPDLLAAAHWVLQDVRKS